jgi:Flp pilus assembly protein TadG
VNWGGIIQARIALSQWRGKPWAFPRLWCSRLWQDTRAAVALEFALVGPMLIALILAILHTALIFLAQQGLETTAEATGRIIMTGQAQQSSMTQAQFKTAACATLPPYLQCSRLYVDVTSVANFSDASTAAPTFTYDNNGNVSNNFSFSTGARGSIAVVRLMYLWPTANGPLGLNFINTAGANRMLLATSVLKTEYY